LSVTIGVVKRHHGAMLAGGRWLCVCKFKLPLEPEGPQGPKEAEIIDAWAVHLASRILYALKRARLLK
jgi:hypothetical protein